MSGQDRWLSGSFVLTPLFSQLASSTIDLFPSRLRNCSSSWIDRFPRNLIGSWILISIIFSTLSGLVSLRSTQIRRGCCASNGVNTGCEPGHFSKLTHASYVMKEFHWKIIGALSVVSVWNSIGSCYWFL